MSQKYQKIDKRKNKKKEEQKREHNLEKHSKELGIGEIFTYPKLCEKLEEPVKRGGGKDSQLKFWSRFFDFETVNRKIVIIEVYDKPKAKPSYFPANTIYTECIEQILLSYLSDRAEEHDGEYTTFVGSQYLYLILGMVNYDYIKMKQPNQKKRLASALKEEFNIDTNTITNFYITDFYDRCGRKFSDIVDTSLKSLQRRALIEYSAVYQLVFEKRNTDGSIHRYSYYTDDYETSIILDLKREALCELECYSEGYVYLRNKQEEYYDLVLEKAQEAYNTDDTKLIGVYKKYKLIYNQENATSALHRDKAHDKQLELNENIIKFINKQAEKNYLNEEETICDENYEKVQQYLSEKLLRI